MIRDANVGPADGRVEPLLGCELADVLGKRRDIFGFIGVGGIAGKEMSIVLHGGAAPRRIDDDRIQRAALRALAIPRVDVPLREGFGAGLLSHMQGQRSTAALAFGKRDVIAELVEEADGGVVEFGA